MRSVAVSKRLRSALSVGADMAFNDCISEIEAAAGRKFSDDEMIELQEALQRRIKLAQAEATLASSDEVIMGVAKDLAAQIKRAAFIEKRNAALALRKGAELYDFVKTNFANDLGQGLKAATVGTNLVRDGSRFSAAAQQKELLVRYMGGFLTDLERAGVLPLLKDGSLDLEMSRALFAIDGPNAAPYKGPVEAKRAADILHKYQEVIRKNYNDAGADIRKEAGYIVKQSHDSDKIRTAGFDEWKKVILNELNMTRTFADGRDPDKALQEVYNNIISGVHLKASDEITGFKGGTMNLGKKASAERILHFKDADSWFRYHTQFGVGSLMDAALRQMETSAQNIGLMRKFGPNPRDTYNRVAARLVQETKDPEVKGRLADDLRRGRMLANYMDELDGTTRIPSNSVLAKIAGEVRAVQTMSKLGGALLASFNDLVTTAAELNYQNGGGIFTNLNETIREAVKGKNRAETREIHESIGVLFEGLAGGIAHRFDPADNTAGLTTRMMQLFFKANGLQWWTENTKAAAIRAFSYNAAFHATKTFDALPKDFSRVISLYGIDAGKWDIIRSLPQKMADGRNYLTPEGIDDAPDSVIESYLTARDRKATPYAVREMREEIKSQFRTFFSDRGTFAVLEADAQTRALLNQGTDPGSPFGVIARFVTQFKSYPTAFAQKVVAREIYGRGSDTLKQAMKNTNGEMLALGQMFVWSTIFGYGALQIKEMAKGREPRVPETLEDYRKLVQASMLQGGGLGIYGDFLFGEMKNRYGQTPVSNLLGPTFGTINDVADLYGRVKNGDDIAGNAVRVILNNTPFYNLFYTKPVMDYLFVYQMQEAINPGYLRRMEERIQKENNSSFIFPPSQYAQ